MGPEMDDWYTTKWKCLLCGSRRKKQIVNRDNTGKVISYSLQCCGCGHIDSFAINQEGTEGMTGYISHVATQEIGCGLLVKNMIQCKDTKCRYRNQDNKNLNKLEADNHSEFEEAPITAIDTSGFETMEAPLPEEAEVARTPIVPQPELPPEFVYQGNQSEPVKDLNPLYATREKQEVHGRLLNYIEQPADPTEVIRDSPTHRETRAIPIPIRRANSNPGKGGPVPK